MAGPQDVDLSPWAVAVAISGGLVGPQFAQFVSAYAIILVGWFAGLLYGLYTRSPESKMPVWAYAIFTLIVCLMSTVFVSSLAVRYIPFFTVEYTALLFPVAAAIPALPDKWGDFGRWLIERANAVRGIQR